MKQFRSFRLDIANQCLWRQLDDLEEQRIALTPKGFAVLSYLVDHAPRLVTHEELLDAAWPKTVVQPEVLSSHIRDLRGVLGDDPRRPKFIETLARRGYRFIAPVTEGLPEAGVDTAARLVGRAGALAKLDEHLRLAHSGKRQIVFVTGEPGIGKTALVDEFQRHATARLPNLRVIRGQCIEGYGGHEAYYPILKAVSELCRGPGGASIVRTLALHAPTWLIQFPALFEQESRKVAPRDIIGATPARMLREISETLEGITDTSVLVMILEDLQWVDLSTLDFISEIARRRGTAKLMLVMTYRPLDVAFTNHPLQALKQDLRARQLCHDLGLSPLQESDIAEYLGSASADCLERGGLAAVLYQHSEGNPLFMVAALDEMAERGLVSRRDGTWQATVALGDIDIQVPESLREMIEAQIERLDTDQQRVLEGASIAGTSFAASLCAPIVGITAEQFAELCEPIARRHHIIRPGGRREFPDGRYSPTYEFVHVLYREVLRRRQTPGLRSSRHRQLGETIEVLYGSDTREVAAELVEHFEEGLEWTRTVKYLRLAAETAQHRFAHREAETLLRRALELIERMPASHRADAQTDTLRRLASTYVASFDGRCVETYEAMAARAAYYNLTALEIRALVDLSYCLSWFSAERALEALERAMRLSDQLADPLLRAAERMNCLVGRVWVGGWNAQDAHEAREALTVIRAAGDRYLLAPHLIGYSQIQWIFSEYREARDCAVEGLAILTEYGGGNPYLSIPFQRGQVVLPRTLLFLGEWGEALSEIDAAITLADKNGDFLPAQMLQLNRAWIHLEAMDFGGVLEICERVTRAGGHFASGYVLRFSLILGGAAEVGLGRYELALEKLSAARHGIDHQRILGDWYFRMPLDAALVDLWLAKKSHAAARRASERLLSAALETEERTYQALAWDACARVAAAEGERERASECIGKALAIIESHELPLAAWRVHATAAELAVVAGRDDRGHRGASRGVVLELAASLQSRQSLRETFLSAAPIARLVTS